MINDRVKITEIEQRYLLDKDVYANLLKERTYSDDVLESIPGNLREANKEARKRRERKEEWEKKRREIIEKKKEDFEENVQEGEV